MITQADVAKAAGVSQSAVSKALLGGGGKTTKVSEKMVEHIRNVAKNLGYCPNLLAQRLARNTQNVIGIIIDSCCCGLYTDIMIEIERLATQAGYRLQVGLVHDSLANIETYVNDFLGYGIQNIICFAHYYDFAEQVPPLFDRFRNPVFISKPMTSKKFAFVSPDYYANFYEAVDYLLKEGHRKIIYAKTAYDTYDARVRVQALRDAYAKHHLPLDEAQIFCKPLRNMDTPELMTQLLDDILPLKPDAIIVGGQTCINLCIRQLKERGLRVPEDISIVSLDCWPGHRYCIPNVTTINNEFMTIAHETFKLVIENVGKRRRCTKEIFIRGHLDLGETCISR